MIMKVLLLVVILIVFSVLMFFILRAYRSMMYGIFVERGWDGAEDLANKASGSSKESNSVEGANSGEPSESTEASRESEANKPNKKHYGIFVDPFSKPKKVGKLTHQRFSYFPFYITILLHATLITFYGNYMTNVMIGYIGNETVFSLACLFNLILIVPVNLCATAISCYRMKKPFMIATIAGTVFTLLYIIAIVSKSVAFLL